MTALVASNAAGTSFTLMIKDATAGWTLLHHPDRQRLRPLVGRGDRRGAVVSARVLFCSEIPLADFGQVNLLGLVADRHRRAKVGSLSAFDANEITMSDNGTTLATPSSLSSDRVVVLGDLEQLVAPGSTTRD